MSMTLSDIETVYNCQPTPSIIINTDSPNFTITTVNTAFLEALHLEKQDIVGRGYFEAFPMNPDDTGSRTKDIKDAFEYVLQFKKAHQIEKHEYNLPTIGSDQLNVHYWKIDTYPLLDKNNEVLYIVQSSVDVTSFYFEVAEKLKAIHASQLSNDLERLEKQVLQLNSEKRVSSTEVLSFYVSGIEALYPEMHCSILQVKNNQLYNWASPSLPASYIQATEGLTIGNNVGSCGTSAFLKKQVIVSDIAHDPIWANFKNLALKEGLKACWSHPIISSEGEVMATFALYYRKVKIPNLQELNIIERATSLLIVILENKLYAQALKDNALLISQGQELAHFGNWSWDIKSNVVSWSDALYVICGLNKYDVKLNMESFQEILHPDDRDRVNTAIKLLLETKINVELEERIIRPDGEIRYFKSWKSIQCDKDGTPIKLFGASLDITDSVKIQETLKLRNELYTFVNIATNDAIYDCNLVKNHIQWGDAFYRVFGYQSMPDTFPIEQWIALIHEDDVQLVKNSFYDLLKNRDQTNWKTEYRFKKANGDYAVVEENGYILRDPNGQAVRMIGVLRDITESKIVKSELEAVKNRYRDIFHLSPQPMFVYELDSLLILDVNSAFIEHYGYSEEELLSMTIKDLRPSEDIEILDEILLNEIKPGLSHTSVTRHIKKSGELISVITKGNSISYDGKEARIVIAVDNTDILRAEQSLIASERRFKTLIQDGANLIAILDYEGKFMYVSPNAEHILNIDYSLEGKNAFDFINEDDRTQIMKEFSMIDHQKRIELSPFRFTNGDHEIRWLQTVVTDMREDSAIRGIVVNARDVTIRMQQELKIKEHLERFNIVSKATSDTIWDANLITGEFRWNQGIHIIFGYKEVSGSNWWENHVHPDDLQKVTDNIQLNIKQKISRWTSEYRFRCADGTYKFVLDRGFMMFNDEGQAIRMIGAMQDITERVNYIQTIEQKNLRLREIAWTQAHLVRAPLARIMGLINVINDHSEEESQEDLFNYLNISVKELDDIIHDVIEKSHN